mmetsp:Transcript_72884/g.236820  ORF Transcript_72884/g.236820 Transcript_72884/m.236820 type:complete len:254 (+) Transcript_72884:101-862(+)
MDLEGFAQEDPRGELDFGPVPESPKVDHRGKLSALHCRPDDGLLLDADFEHICRTTVAAQSQRLVLQTMHQAKVLSKEGGIGGESVVTTSPSRLANFFRGDGAVYAQYNLAAATYSGGALPTPWTACRSRTTGKVYYANAETGATQWEPPLYPLCREWKTEQSPQSGAIFYVHKETGKWQWERPVDEDFTAFQGAGNSDSKALQLWQARHGSYANPDFAGLEDLPAAQTAMQKALPAIADEPMSPMLLARPSP